MNVIRHAVCDISFNIVTVCPSGVAVAELANNGQLLCASTGLRRVLTDVLSDIFTEISKYSVSSPHFVYVQVML